MSCIIPEGGVETGGVESVGTLAGVCAAAGGASVGGAAAGDAVGVGTAVGAAAGADTVKPATPRHASATRTSQPMERRSIRRSKQEETAALGGRGHLDVAGAGEREGLRLVEDEAELGDSAAEDRAQALRLRLHHVGELSAARRRRGRRGADEVADAGREAGQGRRATRCLSRGRCTKHRRKQQRQGHLERPSRHRSLRM